MQQNLRRCSRGREEEAVTQLRGRNWTSKPEQAVGQNATGILVCSRGAPVAVRCRRYGCRELSRSSQTKRRLGLGCILVGASWCRLC